MQLLHRTARGRNRCDFAPSLTQAAINFLQRGRLAGPSGAAQIDGEITRVEDLLDSALLFVAQMLGGPKLMCAAQPPVLFNAMVHHRNHALFAIQALVCCQPVAGMNDGSLGFFDFQCAA